MEPSSFERVVEAREYMLRLAGSPIGRTYKLLALSELGLGLGDAVVDLGCGPGADLATYAEAVGSTGIVLGVDHDEAAVGQARERTSNLAQVQVRRGDVHALPLGDESFDAVHTDRVLQHVLDPAAALGEAARVLKVGGRAVFAEPDWRTLLVDHPDVRLPEVFARYVNDHQIRNPRLGSQLRRLCHGAGLVVETVSNSCADEYAPATRSTGKTLHAQRGHHP